MSDNFKFDLGAKRTRLTDDDLLSALELAVENTDGNYLSTTQYDSLPGKHPHSVTIASRFGSWKKALALIGISGGRERRYTPEELIKNLETIWKQLGYPPGKRQLSKLGSKISESPYRKHWGSVKAACEALAAFHNGKIIREQLIAGNSEKPTRITIPLKDRWAVLKKDNYYCKKCGASPSNDHNVTLEVDHIFPVANGGGNSLDNLQTLCQKCNQGKKDR